jgi:hypothetical protein
MSMQYGNITVIDIIAWLVIDDGNAGRENRLAMFNDSNAYFGVFSDEHPTEGH